MNIISKITDKSYNYGAHRPKRVRKAMVTLAAMILVYTIVMWSVIIFAPDYLIAVFSSDKLLIKDAVPALKTYFAAFIFMDNTWARPFSSP